MDFFRKINEQVVENSDDPRIFLLIHKIDMLPKDKKEESIENLTEQISETLLEE